MRTQEFSRGLRQPSPPCPPFVRPEMPRLGPSPSTPASHQPPPTLGSCHIPTLGTLTSLHLSLSQGRSPAESPRGARGDESDKPVLLQSHYLPRQAAATAAFTPPLRSSDKEGAERWEFLPPCSEARNQPFIPALRLLISAGGAAGRLRCLGHTCSDWGHADPRGPGAPLQEERLWPLRAE